MSIINGLRLFAVGAQLLNPNAIQPQENPVLPPPLSVFELDSVSTPRLSGTSLLRRDAFFDLGTAYVDYVPLSQHQETVELEFTPEQQAVYDEISAIYGTYGIVFKFSKEGVLDQSRTTESAVTLGEAIIFETPEGKYRLLEKALSILGTIYGSNINKYIDRIVEGEEGGAFAVIVGSEGEDGVELTRAILLNTDYLSTYGTIRRAAIHEGVHAMDLGYKAHTVDEYLALQLIKAKITLSLTNPHIVWNNHYANRYDTWSYSPYLQIGAYLDEHMEELVSFNTAYSNETLSGIIAYSEGLGTDGYISDVDKIYIGLEAFRLKLANPDQRLPEGLEEVLSDSLFRMTNECFAVIASSVLLGNGYFDDPEIKKLLQDYFDVVRPADERIDVDDLAHELRYGYYENTLEIPPYDIQSP